MVVLSTTFTPPSSDCVIYDCKGAKLVINDRELGTAPLYVTENNVVWGGGVGAAGGPSPSISLLYPDISLHAIQRDPTPALYMVLNYELKLPELIQEPGDGDTNADDDDFDAENVNITELRFIPENVEELESLYNAMSQGQTMNPDPTDEMFEEPDVDEFEEDDEFEDAEEINGGPEEALARLRQMRIENSNGVHYEDCDDAEIGEE